jgi:hypothetical protein
VKTLAKRPKVSEKKGVEHVKAFGTRMSGSSKQPSGVNILLVKSVKLSKGDEPLCVFHLRCVVQKISAALWILEPVMTVLVVEPDSERKNLLPPLRNASFLLLGLWLQYLWNRVSGILAV